MDINNISIREIINKHIHKDMSFEEIADGYEDITGYDVQYKFYKHIDDSCIKADNEVSDSEIKSYHRKIGTRRYIDE